ncbi:hypothetical protein MDAP_002835 [Mitosporidium daphniae]
MSRLTMDDDDDNDEINTDSSSETELSGSQESSGNEAGEGSLKSRLIASRAASKKKAPPKKVVKPKVAARGRKAVDVKSPKTTSLVKDLEITSQFSPSKSVLLSPTKRIGLSRQARVKPLH